MSVDKNDPQYPIIKFSDTEGHEETCDQSYKSNVKDAEHPYFSSAGIVSVINAARNASNTKEEQLSGKVKDKVIEDIADAAKKTKVPYDLLLFVVDWVNDITKRGDAGDASGIAQKMLSYLPELRQSLGRDPLNAEIFMAHALNSASKVKELLDKSQQQPEEEASSPGSQKDDLVINKVRGEKTQKRTNRELYDYWYKRVPVGKIQFHQDLGKDPYSK